MALTINLDILKEGIRRSREKRMHQIPNYVPVGNYYEELFFIETTTAGCTMLEDEYGNNLIEVGIDDKDMTDSLGDVANIFYKRMYKYINQKQEEALDDGRINRYVPKDTNEENIEKLKTALNNIETVLECMNQLDIWTETKPVDYEQKYWDCQRQIDEYERERKELQEQIDILDNKNIELREDKNKAEQHIKELKEKISELESKNKRLDERNTYITHHFGDERRAKERIEKRYISLLAAADSVLELINNAIDITKEPDPSWTLVEERIIAAHNELISYVEQKDDLTDFAKKSCEGCEYEDYPRTFGKRCSCCDDYAFYTPKKD